MSFMNMATVCAILYLFMIHILMMIPIMIYWEDQESVSKCKEIKSYCVFRLLTPALLFVLIGTYYTILWRRLFSSCDLSQPNTLQIIISGLPADTLPKARATKPTGTVPFLLSRFFSYTGKRKKKKR